jgi:hypothetical protein
MPWKRSDYPTDWEERRARILDRAKHRCERCGLPNHAVGYRDDDGRFVPNAGNLVCDDSGRGMNYETGHRLTATEAREFVDQYNDCTVGKSKRLTDWEGNRWFFVRLTIAHTVEDGPLDCPDSDLLALCERCHNRMDAPMRRRNANRTLQSRRAVGSLFPDEAAR